MKYINVILVLLSALTGLQASSALRTSMTAEPRDERIVVEPGKTLRDFGVSALDYTRTDVDPGTAPEGDYLGWPVFTPDGDRVLLTNRGTNNVTVMDWASMSVDTNIHVGSYPGAIAVTDNYALVTLGFVDSLVVIRLSDYSIAARLPTDSQPWVIRVSPDEDYAYVACDISNTCNVFDLNTLTPAGTIENFPLFLSTYSWNSENGRNAFTFSGFEITPDGSHLMLPDGRDSIFFYDVATGAIDDTITGIGSCRFLAFSGDGLYAVTANGANPCLAHLIDLELREVVTSVEITGHQLMTFEGAVDEEGTKAYLGVSGNVSALVRFETEDFMTFSSTYTAFWIGVSPDHTLAISGNYRFSIIDFENEEMLGQHQGNSQSLGAVSPFETRVVAADPHRHEGLYCYDYDDPGPDMYLGTVNAGEDPEGDCPHRVAVTPDGLQAVAAGVLSDNVSIIDLGSNTVNAILPTGDRPQEIGITSDSRWAVVAATGSDQVAVIDLDDNSVAAVVPTGAGPYSVSISPDDSFAWIGNLSGNSVSRILIDGAQSREVAQIPVGEIGIVWAAYGVPSDVRACPNGRYVLVAVSFSDMVQIIDATTNSVCRELPVGDFPLQFAFDATGQYAVVTNAFSNNISVLIISGETSAVVGTFSRGQYPLRAAYNPVDDVIGIVHLNSRTLVEVEPSTGNQVSSRSYASYGSPIQVSYDADGTPLVLCVANQAPHYLVRDTQVITLPATPCFFDYQGLPQRAAVAMPGPDWVTTSDWSSSGVKQEIPLTPDRGLTLSVASVARDRAFIRYSLPEPGAIRISLYDATGRLVKVPARRSSPAGNFELAAELTGLPGGVYLLRLDTGHGSASCRLLKVE